MKTIAAAMLITGATVLTASAQVKPYAVHNVSVHWTVYMPDTSTTNAHTGTITDTYKTTTLTTASLITNIANALGTTFKASATLEAISELSLGTNLEGATNVVSTVYKYTNSTTNIFLYSTNVYPTNTTGVSNTTVSLTNLYTNFVYSITNKIAVATNVTYYINSGGTLTPLTNTVLGLDNLISGGLLYATGSTNSVQLAQDLTNSVFKGTIKTNLQVTGSRLFHGQFDVDAAGAGNLSKAAGPDVTFWGHGFATAATGSVGTGKTAVPWSTWNVTLAGGGYGNVGGAYTVSYTNITETATNVYYTSTNATSVEILGDVTHTFAKIVQ